MCTVFHILKQTCIMDDYGQRNKQSQTLLSFASFNIGIFRRLPNIAEYCRLNSNTSEYSREIIILDEKK